MGLIKGTIGRVPPFSLWNEIRFCQLALKRIWHPKTKHGPLEHGPFQKQREKFTSFQTSFKKGFLFFLVFRDVDRLFLWFLKLKKRLKKLCTNHERILCGRKSWTTFPPACWKKKWTTFNSIKTQKLSRSRKIYIIHIYIYIYIYLSLHFLPPTFGTSHSHRMDQWS